MGVEKEFSLTAAMGKVVVTAALMFAMIGMREFLNAESGIRPSVVFAGVICIGAGINLFMWFDNHGFSRWMIWLIDAAGFSAYASLLFPIWRASNNVFSVGVGMLVGLALAPFILDPVPAEAAEGAADA